MKDESRLRREYLLGELRRWAGNRAVKGLDSRPLYDAAQAIVDLQVENDRLRQAYFSITDPKRALFLARIEAELYKAYNKHGRQRWSRHEFYAILKEEVDELWDEVKKDGTSENFEKEMVQVAAMCFRYFETGNSRFGPGEL